MLNAELELKTIWLHGASVVIANYKSYSKDQCHMMGRKDMVNYDEAQTTGMAKTRGDEFSHGQWSLNDQWYPTNVTAEYSRVVQECAGQPAVLHFPRLISVYQGRSQPHRPGWARVPLSLLFPQIVSFFFFFCYFSSNFTYFLPHRLKGQPNTMILILVDSKLSKYGDIFAQWYFP